MWCLVKHSPRWNLLKALLSLMKHKVERFPCGTHAAKKSNLMPKKSVPFRSGNFSFCKLWSCEYWLEQKQYKEYEKLTWSDLSLFDFWYFPKSTQLNVALVPTQWKGSIFHLNHLFWSVSVIARQLNSAQNYQFTAKFAN